jgi:hypothetical protein
MNKRSIYAVFQVFCLEIRMKSALLYFWFIPKILQFIASHRQIIQKLFILLFSSQGVHVC